MAAATAVLHGRRLGPVDPEQPNLGPTLGHSSHRAVVRDVVPVVDFDGMEWRIRSPHLAAHAPIAWEFNRSDDVPVLRSNRERHNVKLTGRAVASARSDATVASSVAGSE